MKPIRTLVSSVDINIQSKQSIINCSQSIQINLCFRHLLGCMFSYSCAYAFDVFFLCFLRNCQDRLQSEMQMVRNSTLTKFILNRKFIFLICFENDYSNLKAVICFLSHTQKYTNSTFSSWVIFFIATAHVQDFLPNHPHSKDLSLILETPGSIIDSIYGLLLLSRALQDSIYATVSKSFIPSSVYMKTDKLWQERYLSLGPLNKYFILSSLHINYSHSHYPAIQLENLDSTKNLVCFVLFFIDCTEQNTK